ncbi:phosphate ABC transporter substrate-binding/OmpA family protein [Halovulum sp. GXIMD14794]
MTAGNVPPSPFRLVRRLALAAGLGCAVSAAPAQTVQLISPSGSASVSGTLTGVTDGVYQLNTLFGPVSIAADEVRCLGEACPGGQQATVVAAADPLALRMLPRLFEGLAFSLGGLAAAQEGGGPTRWLGLTSTESPPLFTAELMDLSVAGGLPALLEGGWDIAAVTVPPLGARHDGPTARALRRLEREAAPITVGIEGVVLVAHPDLPIESLTLEEATALFSGRIRSWSELGGPDLPVRLVAQPDRTPASQVLKARILTSGKLPDTARTLADDDAVADLVAETPGAVGYVGLDGAGETRVLGLTGACGLVPEPGAFSAKTGEYPLHHRVTLLSGPGPLPADVAALRGFAGSSGVDTSVRDAGLIDMSVLRRDQNAAAPGIRAAIEISPDEAQVNLLRELYIDLLEWDRLSTTFRFDPEDPIVLAPATGPDLERLGAYLSRLPAGTDVAFAGFTDSEGGFDERLRLSEFRADVVYSALAEVVAPEVLSRLRIHMKGYADLKPVGCFADEDGRRLNRRVEIWVRR